MPLGFLYIDETGYEWTKVNTAFEPVEAAENGSGSLDYSGPYFVPRDGPMASWGVLISQGAKNIPAANWLLMYPAFFLISTLFALNFIGDGLRDALDPKDR